MEAILKTYKYQINPLNNWTLEKGNRRYFTVGAGIKYNVFGIDLSYLVPTSVIPNPLDNTLRFSLLFDFSVFKSDLGN